ncbi:hypothetical protein AWC38_SpisGene24952 [Stylophora pistillata]|uniref:PD-(D/E)XK endonuclease-like domain-containing protein n=1 Tax=Stylophora pistillata TaxID=50429 RepID=A0A2B4R126_STYPI|nr:hypothetical protein AWC38_SpisGene24952 [Stylophora pistillata]
MPISAGLSRFSTTGKEEVGGDAPFPPVDCWHVMKIRELIDQKTSKGKRCYVQTAEFLSFETPLTVRTFYLEGENWSIGRLDNMFRNLGYTSRADINGIEFSAKIRSRPYKDSKTGEARKGLEIKWMPLWAKVEDFEKELQKGDNVFVTRLEKIIFESPRRKHLGPSQIGHGCERKLWLDLHKSENRDRVSYGYQQHDLFERGHWEEERVLSYLKRTGFWIDQTQVPVQSCHPDFKGTMDARIIDLRTGETYVLEIKTMKQEHFKRLMKKGCQETQFGYWVQCQCYMGMSNIPQTLFVVRNKNTEELYEEIIPFDAKLYDLLLQKFKRIQESKGPPLGYTALTKPHFECAWCAYTDFCWKGKDT